MAKVYIQTHGCSTNFSESEIMAGLLADAGFGITGDKKLSDAIIISICTVKGENTALREIKRITAEFPGKRLVIAGCLTNVLIKNARKIDENASFISTHNIKSICEIVEESVNGNAVELLAKENDAKLNMPKIRKNPAIGIIPILNSCRGSCIYCSVRAIKGKLFSYPAENIIKEADICLNEGCKELWITSQDNASYMLEKGRSSKLPELLKSIVGIEDKFMLRIGMMNPNNAMPIVSEMIDIYKNEKVFKFLHLPVQSGNDEILKLMNRKYDVNSFKNIINKFRKEIPDVTISTDIICGFPTETEEQFNDSLSLIKEIRPDIVNISRFQPRANTKAAKMEQIHGSITKNRSRVLTEISSNISRMINERWLGWEGAVLVDEKGKDNSWIGRNFAYKPVVVKGDFRLGQEVNVKIGKVTAYDLRGEQQTI